MEKNIIMKSCRPENTAKKSKEPHQRGNLTKLILNLLQMKITGDT